MHSLSALDWFPTWMLLWFFTRSKDWPPSINFTAHWAGQTYAKLSSEGRSTDWPPSVSASCNYNATGPLLCLLIICTSVFTHPKPHSSRKKLKSIKTWYICSLFLQCQSNCYESAYQLILSVDFLSLVLAFNAYPLPLCHTSLSF